MYIIIESLCYTSETYMILYINYIPTEERKERGKEWAGS